MWCVSDQAGAVNRLPTGWMTSTSNPGALIPVDLEWQVATGEEGESGWQAEPKLKVSESAAWTTRARRSAHDRRVFSPRYHHLLTLAQSHPLLLPPPILSPPVPHAVAG